MKVTQHMMDVRILRCIQALEEYKQCFSELNQITKVKLCDETLTNLKVIAYDTAEVIEITEDDDPELVAILSEPISLPGKQFTYWTYKHFIGKPLYQRIHINEYPHGIEIIANGIVVANTDYMGGLATFFDGIEGQWHFYEPDQAFKHRENTANKA